MTPTFVPCLSCLSGLSGFSGEVHGLANQQIEQTRQTRPTSPQSRSSRQLASPSWTRAVGDHLARPQGRRSIEERWIFLREKTPGVFKMGSPSSFFPTGR